MATSSSVAAVESSSALQSPSSSSPSSHAPLALATRSLKGFIRGVGAKASLRKGGTSGDSNASENTAADDFESRRFIASAFSRSPYFHLPGQHEVQQRQQRERSELDTGTCSPSAGSLHHQDDESEDEEDQGMHPFRRMEPKSKWASARFRLENLATRSDYYHLPPHFPASRSKDPLTASASFPLLELARVEQHNRLQRSLKQQQSLDPKLEEASLKAIATRQPDCRLMPETAGNESMTGGAGDPQDDGVGGGSSRGSGESRHSMSQAELEPLRRILMSRKRSIQFQSIAESLLMEKKRQHQEMRMHREQDDEFEISDKDETREADRDEHKEERIITVADDEDEVVFHGKDSPAEQRLASESSGMQEQQQEESSSAASEGRQEVASSSPESRSPSQQQAPQCQGEDASLTPDKSDSL